MADATLPDNVSSAVTLRCSGADFFEDAASAMSKASYLLPDVSDGSGDGSGNAAFSMGTPPSRSVSGTVSGTLSSVSASALSGANAPRLPIGKPETP